MGTNSNLNKLGHTSNTAHGLSSGALTDLKGNSTPIKSSTLGGGTKIKDKF